MSNKFTEKAEKAMAEAHGTAERLGHTYIGTEHIFLGLTKDKDSIGGALLSRIGFMEKNVERMIIEISGKGTVTELSVLDLTPRAKNDPFARAEPVTEFNSDSTPITISLIVFISGQF